jgi:hypothetical protein
MKLYGIVFLLGYLTSGFRRIVAGYVQNFRHDTFKASKKAPGIPKFRGVSCDDPLVNPHLDTFRESAWSQVSEVASFFRVELFDRNRSR